MKKAKLDKEPCLLLAGPVEEKFVSFPLLLRTRNKCAERRNLLQNPAMKH